MSGSTGFSRWLTESLRQVIRFDLRFMLMLMTVSAVALLWWQDRERLESRLAALEGRFNPTPLVGVAWAAEQATGAPNTTTPGDRPTAWASLTPDGQPEWLELTYARAVKPFEVEVHANCCPGAITKVTGFNQFGKEVILWQGTDPTLPTAPSGVSTFRVNPNVSTDRVRVYLASDKFPGWNEIDAVGLHYGWFGQVMWADKANASSDYGARYNYSGAGGLLNFGFSR